MISVVRGDITAIPVDAIVNAANSSLLGGGGVDGAIHEVGGPQILDDCLAIREKQGGCPTGEAVITRAGNLPATYVIHTVGPVWKGGDHNEERLLSSAYLNSLKLAFENNVKTISFPGISTGVYHFPKDKAAEIAVSTVRGFLNTVGTINEVIFVCFDEESYLIYNKLLSKD